MSSIRRILILLIIALGGIAFSQAPEFAQKYRERLGGAIDELTALIQNFDAHANHSGLDRQAALNVYADSSENFIRSQGEGVRQSFQRYEALIGQLEEMTAASPVLRPLVVIRHLDQAIFADTWRDFTPAVPGSVADGVWAVIGMMAGLLAVFLIGVAIKACIWLAMRPRARKQSTLAGAGFR